MEEKARAHPLTQSSMATSGRAFRPGERIQGSPRSTVQRAKQVPFALWATAPGWLLM